MVKEEREKKGFIESILGGIKNISGRIEKVSEKRRIRKYGAPSEFKEMMVLKEVAGDYGSMKERLHKDSVIALIFGKRGSGKSALGFRLLENIHSLTKRKCFVLGVRQGFLPRWISSVDDVEKVENDGVILVDEGAISFGARESMRAKNKELANLMAVARHKNLTLIFVTQNTSMLDKNILKLSDVLFIKEGSLLQLEMERPEIKKFYGKAKDSFEDAVGDKRCLTYTIDSDFEGAISYRLPSFWRDDLSKNRA
jgi:hypothetical protein